MLTTEIEEKLCHCQETRGVESVILVGFEAHVCIVATCIDLISRGFHVSCYKANLPMNYYHG